MKFIVVSTDYPSEKKPYAMSYVHSRVQTYMNMGHDVKVLSFKASSPYCFDGVTVVPKTHIDPDMSECDFLVFHAPNLKNHMPLILRAIFLGKKVFLTIHGHEFLDTGKFYPRSYWYKDNKKNKFVRALYDFLKIFFLRVFFGLIPRDKVSLVYVSEWMRNAAVSSVGCRLLEFDSTVIPNPSNLSFVENSYCRGKIVADFITIRPLDDSKYCIDLVVEAALANPDLKFHIYGKGSYFSYNEIPNNVTVYDKFMNQKDLPQLLNLYRGALMPTRLDAQGVMACEMVDYGIPLVTTDIDICKEMLSHSDRVFFLSFEEFCKKDRLSLILSDIEKMTATRKRFTPASLAASEIQFFNEG